MTETLFFVLIWAIVILVCWKWFLKDFINKQRATKMAKAHFNARQIPDEDYYEMVSKEISSNQIRTGLWAKAWAEANGDDIKAKAIYLKLRVAAMKNETANFIMGGESKTKANDQPLHKVVVQCLHCKKSLRLDVGRQGKVVCPSCGGKFETQT